MTSLLPDSRLFDTEKVGEMLWHVLGVLAGDPRDGLTRAGIPVHHFLLHTDRGTLVERIETDTKPESAGAKQWRLDHLTDYERALPWLRREAQVVDTTGVLPAEVAETVLRGVRTG